MRWRDWSDDQPAAEMPVPTSGDVEALHRRWLDDARRELPYPARFIARSRTANILSSSHWATLKRRKRPAGPERLKTFPLLTALALRNITSAHSIVFIGLLPLATAIFGVVRGGERPRPAFWPFSGMGSALVAGFALSRGVAASPADDLLMLGAIVICGLG